MLETPGASGTRGVPRVQPPAFGPGGDSGCDHGHPSGGTHDYDDATDDHGDVLDQLIGDALVAASLDSIEWIPTARSAIDDLVGTVAQILDYTRI